MAPRKPPVIFIKGEFCYATTNNNNLITMSMIPEILYNYYYNLAKKHDLSKVDIDKINGYYGQVSFYFNKKESLENFLDDIDWNVCPDGESTYRNLVCPDEFDVKEIRKIMLSFNIF